MKSLQMTVVFVQKEVLGEKIMMFLLKKVDDLGAREREEKVTTNSAPTPILKIQ